MNIAMTGLSISLILNGVAIMYMSCAQYSQGKKLSALEKVCAEHAKSIINLCMCVLPEAGKREALEKMRGMAKITREEGVNI